jgi:hypothetical protein
MQYGRQLVGSAARSMLRPKSDPRAFRNVANEAQGSEMRIAWVGESSLHTRDRRDRKTKKYAHETFVPLEVRDNLVPLLERDVQIDLYLQSAQRLFDLYICAGDALRHNPDLIVLTLNPIFMLNTKAVTYWPNTQVAAVACGYADVGDTGLIALFSGASVVAEGLTAKHSALVRNRFDYGVNAHKWIKPLLGRPKRREGRPDKDTVAGILSVSQPLSFWGRFQYGYSEKGGPGLGPMCIRYGDRSGKAINHDILLRLVRRINRAGVPALIYMAPITSGYWRSPELRVHLEADEEALRRLAGRVAGEGNVRIITDSISRQLPKLRFHDMVHLKDSSAVSKLLAGEILELIRASGLDTGGDSKDEPSI